MRINAVGVLSRIKSDDIIEPLGSALSDKKKTVTVASIRALAKIRNSKSSGYIADVLYHNDKEVRDEAVRALSWIGEPAVYTLIDKLDRSVG